MRAVFMGTPDFAVPAMVSMINAGHEVAAAVTQPDKPKGRGKSVIYTPVKEAAMKYGIPVHQPARVKEPEFIDILRKINPEVIVVVAFGQILPKEILEMPKFGCINVHASLLPKYRGAAPVQWAVIRGEKESGVTTMYMDEGLDTGDMIEKTVVVLDKKETGGSLHDKLAEEGGKLLASTLEKLENGTALRQKQPEGDGFYAKMLTKKLGKIDFSGSAIEIERLIRGLNPWPSAYTSLNGKTIKIWSADVLEITSEEPPGKIIKVETDSIQIQTGDGVLAIRELQMEGKKRMATEAFLRGCHVESGMFLQ